MHNHCTLHLTTNNAQPLTTHPPPGPPGYAEKRLQKRARAQNQNKKPKTLKVLFSMLVSERGRFLHSGFFYIVPKRGSRQLVVCSAVVSKRQQTCCSHCWLKQPGFNFAAAVGQTLSVVTRAMCRWLAVWLSLAAAVSYKVLYLQWSKT